MLYSWKEKGQIRWKEISAFSCALSWQVEELRRRRDICRIRLFFEMNPYFHNKVIVKKYVIHVTGKSRLPGRGPQVVGGGWNVFQPLPMYLSSCRVQGVSCHPNSLVPALCT